MRRLERSVGAPLHKMTCNQMFFLALFRGCRIFRGSSVWGHADVTVRWWLQRRVMRHASSGPWRRLRATQEVVSEAVRHRCDRSQIRPYVWDDYSLCHHLDPYMPLLELTPRFGSCRVGARMPLTLVNGTQTCKMANGYYSRLLWQPRVSVRASISHCVGEREREREKEGLREEPAERRRVEISAEEVRCRNKHALGVGKGEKTHRRADAEESGEMEWLYEERGVKEKK
ncbi:hypothetical protein Q8A73_015968 [Channa argus]|nr:hypothetical protein Q8A73_015968 [Channa argus]